MLLKRAILAFSLGGMLAVTACSGASAVPTGPPAQSAAVVRDTGSAAHGDRNSWMLPEAKNEDLIYTSDMNRHKVFVLALMSGKLVGTLSFSKTPWGLCSDRAGDVFVTRDSEQLGMHGVVAEFAHGSATPIAKVRVPFAASACAIDPASGDLAVSGGGESSLTFAVFAPPFERGPVTTIEMDGSYDPQTYLTYDDKSNLFFVVPSRYGWLFYKVSHISGKPVVLQDLSGGADWSAAGRYGNSLVFANSVSDTIERIRVKGESGRVLHQTVLQGSDLNFGDEQFCVDGRTVAAPYHYDDGHGDAVVVWDYPSGKQLAAYHGFGEQFLVGITISRAPKVR